MTNPQSAIRNPQFPRRRRAGYTLLELTVAVLASGFLIVGLASALWIAARTLDESNSPSVRQIETAAALQQVMNDLRHATSFTERTATAVTFTVPDRNGDEQEETIRYSWSGVAGASLMMEYNGSAPATIATDVQQFDLTYLTRAVTGTGFVKGVIGVAYFEFSEEKAGEAAVNEVTIAKPAGTSTGDLLMAVVVVDRADQTISPPAGWTQISHITNGSELTMGVWWKNATASEPVGYSFGWTDTDQVYGWIMRFNGHNAASPIHAKAETIGVGNSSSPPAPTVTTTVNNTLILRIGGFGNGSVTIDQTGLSGHQSITMDHSASDVSGGAGFKTQPTAATVPSASFSLPSPRRWMAISIAIVPAAG